MSNFSSSISRDEVRRLFQSMLGREPESDEIIAAFQKMSPIDAALQIALSEEAKARAADSPFRFFNSRIPIEAIVRAHTNHSRKPAPGRLVNYLGVKIDPAFLPDVLQNMEGRVEEPPIPANWHADIAEWGAALRAVDLATNTFRVVELGCGWGCWLLNTGVAARERGLKVQLIGAEGDEGHIAFANQAIAENGFSRAEARIFRGVVGPNKGTALFPRQSLAGVSWGLAPIFDASDEQVSAAQKSGSHEILPIITFADLIDGTTVDLLHVDIQGGEADFFEACIDQLAALVRYVVIGTHSRQIEGRLFDLFIKHGWILEVERPAILSLSGDRPVVTVDGVQGWRNPRTNAESI